MAATAVPSATASISYEDLYERWEKGNWRATEIDFSQDLVDWHEKLTEEQRRSALWLYTLFFHGEDSVTDNLSPYIDAAPLEEQKYFLDHPAGRRGAPRGVLQALHARGRRPRRRHDGGGLAATAAELTWGHRQVFARLDRMADELRADRSKRKLAAAVTLYHVIVEACARPARPAHDRDLPRGLRRPPRASAPGCATSRSTSSATSASASSCWPTSTPRTPRPISEAIVGLIREVLPWTTAVAKPPNWDRSYTECFGFTLEDLGEAGAASIEQKLRAIGLPVDTLARFPMPMDLPPRERALRGQKMLRAGLIGPGDEGVRADDEALAILFDTDRPPGRRDAPCARARRSRGTSPTRRRGTSRSTAGVARRPRGPGARRRPHAAQRASPTSPTSPPAAPTPARLMLQRRLRPRGSVRLLLALPRVLG